MNTPVFLPGQHVTDLHLNALMAQIDDSERLVAAGAPRVMACAAAGPFAVLEGSPGAARLRLAPALLALGGRLLDMRAWPADARTLPVPADAAAGDRLALTLGDAGAALTDSIPRRHAPPLPVPPEDRAQPLTHLRVTRRRTSLSVVRPPSSVPPEALVVARLASVTALDPDVLPDCATLGALPALAARYRSRAAGIEAVSQKAEAALARCTGAFGTAERRLAAIADLGPALALELLRPTATPQDVDAALWLLTARACRVAGARAEGLDRASPQGWADATPLLEAALAEIVRDRFAPGGQIVVPPERVALRRIGNLVEIRAALEAPLGALIGAQGNALAITVAGEGVPVPGSPLACHPEKSRARLLARLGRLATSPADEGFGLRIPLAGADGQERIEIDELLSARVLRLVGEFHATDPAAVRRLSVTIKGE